MYLYGKKNFKYEDTKNAVLEIANFIHANGKVQQRIRNFIEELEL